MNYKLSPLTFSSTALLAGILFSTAARAQITANQRIGAYIGGPGLYSSFDSDLLESEVFQHPLRKCQGKIYDLTKLVSYYSTPENQRGRLSSSEWKCVGGEVISVVAEGVLISQGRSSTAFIRHCRDHAIDGQGIYTYAVRTGGVYQYETAIGARATAEEYDVGEALTAEELKALQPKPPTPEQVAAQKSKTTAVNDRAAAAALKSNQDAAARGDEYGQLRMGQRYLAGEGVARDAAQARKYFILAASQGNTSASNALQRLNEPAAGKK